MVHHMNVAAPYFPQHDEIPATELRIGDAHQCLTVTGTETRPDGTTVVIWSDGCGDTMVMTFEPGAGIDVHNR